MIDPTGTYRTVGCTAAQREAIRKAMDDLCDRLKHTSLLPPGFPGLACLQSRCGLARGGHGGVIICRSASDPNCKSPDPKHTICAYTLKNPVIRQDINICPPAFSIGGDCGCLGSKIAHEFLHSCIGDLDHYWTGPCEVGLFGSGTPPCPQ
jgi:hypothetical protein